MPARPAEDRIPDGLDAVIDIDAPFERHAPVLRSTGEPPRAGGRSPWRVLGLLGALVLAAVVVVALADFRPSPEVAPSSAPASEAVAITPGPTATPEPSPTPFDGPTPAATVGPYWPAQINLPVLTIPAEDARMAVQDPTLAAPSSGNAKGPFVYLPFADPNGESRVIDIGNNTASPMRISQKQEEQYWTTVADGRWLAILLVAGVDINCPKSLAWRIVATPLRQDGQIDVEAGGFAEIARGVAKGVEIPGQDCPLTWAPAMRLAGGVLGWIEDPVKGSAGSVIHLRDLRGGGDREIKTQHHAINLALSTEAVAWVESADLVGILTGASGITGDGSQRFEWSGMEASLRDPAAAPFRFTRGTAGAGPMPPSLVLDGAAVVTTAWGGDSNAAAVTRIAVDGSSEVIDDGAHGRECTAVDAAGGVVLLRCYWPDLIVMQDGNDRPLAMAAVWTASSGLRVVTVGQAMPLESWSVEVRAGWAILSGMNGYTAIPMSALGAP
ncbi:MAG: hypothetical protein U0838_17445 [Chloroflexota bacterium]